MITIYAAYNYPEFVHGVVRDLRLLWAAEELGLPYRISGSIRPKVSIAAPSIAGSIRSEKFRR